VLAIPLFASGHGENRTPENQAFAPAEVDDSALLLVDFDLSLANSSRNRFSTAASSQS